jgi:cation:H+ antiporter
VSFVAILIGLALLVAGGELVVRGASRLALAFGLSPVVVGLTVVAFGTSSPELAVTIGAIADGSPDVAVGNVIGSNIYNVLGILGITAAVHPIAIPAEIARLDIWVLVAANLLVFLFLRTGWTFHRWEGAVFVLLYGLYVGYLVLGALPA